MRICYILTRSDALGGVQVHVKNFAKKMKSEGHEVNIILGGEGPYYQMLVTEGFSVISLKYLKQKINPFYDLLALIEIIKYVKAINPEILSTHSSKAGVLGRLASYILGIPSLFTAHGWAFTEGVSRFNQYLYSKIETAMAPLSKKIITVSNYDFNLAIERKIVPQDKLIAIHNGMPEISMDLYANVVGKKVKIIMVARFDHQKDHLTLLTSLSEIKHLDWDLDLIGDGPLFDEIKNSASFLGINERINFVGQVEDVVPYLKDSQIFTLISNWEGLPRSIIEAMRSGLPIIATDVAGVKEMVGDEINGYLIPRKDVKTLAKRLESMINNQQVRLEMSKQSLKIFKEEFTLEKTFNKTFDVYMEITNS